MSVSLKEVGRIKAIYRYPVKSMAGESVEAVGLRWVGVGGDRRYSFVRSGNTSRFPWLTAKVLPELLRFQAYFVAPDDPNMSAVRVRTPNGLDLAIDSPELCQILAGLYGADIHLLQLGRGLYDSSPLSLISLTTVSHLGEVTKADADPLRFRPNFVLETSNGQPFVEDEWIGRTLVLGNHSNVPCIRVDRPSERCVMVNLDPYTVKSNPAVLKELVSNHQNNAEVYCSVEQLGEMTVGEVVFIR